LLICPDNSGVQRRPVTCEYVLAVGVCLAVRDDGAAEGALYGNVETADAREERQDARAMNSHGSTASHHERILAMVSTGTPWTHRAASCSSVRPASNRSMIFRSAPYRRARIR